MKPAQGSIIDLGELKIQIVKRIGAEGAKKYIYYLNRFLSQKLNKCEFDKLCYRVLGRENLPLHNQLIRSILKNACNAKVPPPLYRSGPTKSLVVVDEKVTSAIEDGHEPSGSIVPTQIQPPHAWSNGVVLPMSPKKSRSGLRDRKAKDRPSAPESNGKLDLFSQHSSVKEDGRVKVLLGNGEMTLNNYKSTWQHPAPDIAKDDVSVMHSVNSRTANKSTDAPSLPVSNGQIGVSSFVHDGQEVEHAHYLEFSRSALIAPLGIPFYSTHKSRRITATSGDVVSISDSGGLPDTELLKKRMEQIAESHGLGGVSTQCASTMNTMLDMHMRKLIKSCVDLVKSRSTHEPRKQDVAPGKYIQTKVINGLRTINHHQSSEEIPKNVQTISLVDFKAAMELNPQQLGGDWPLQLEKICIGFEK